MDFEDQRQLAHIARDRAMLVHQFLDDCDSMFRSFAHMPMVAGCDDGQDRWVALSDNIQDAVALVCESILDGNFDGLDDIDFFVQTYESLCRNTVCLHSNLGSPNHSTTEELLAAVEVALPEHVVPSHFAEVAEWLGFDE